MTCYTVIKSALDRVYETIPGTEVERDALIKVALDRLSGGLNDLRSRQPIDYSKPESHFAYLFKYSGGRASCIHELQATLLTCLRLYDQPALKVVSLGCGPGSDLLGVSKLWFRTERTASLSFCLVDAKREWRTSLLAIKDGLLPHFSPQPWPSCRFLPADLSAAPSDDLLQHMSEANLFTVSYLLCELLQDGVAQRLLDTMFNAAPRGAVFVIVDNNMWEMRDLLGRAAARPDLDVKQHRSELIQLPQPEQVTDLEVHLTKFGDQTLGRYPHFNLNSTYLIAVKR